MRVTHDFRSRTVSIELSATEAVELADDMDLAWPAPDRAAEDAQRIREAGYSLRPDLRGDEQ